MFYGFGEEVAYQTLHRAALLHLNALSRKSTSMLATTTLSEEHIYICLRKTVTCGLGNAIHIIEEL